MSPLPPDSLSYTDLGGTKLEYSSPVDTSTDRSADEVNLAFAATAAMTRTAIRSWCQFVTDGSGNPTLTAWEASWKGGSTVPPSVTLVTTGKYLITYPATVTDEQGNTHSVNFKAVMASICSTSDALIATGYQMQPMVLTANTIRVWSLNIGGGGVASPTNALITVFII